MPASDDAHYYENLHRINPFPALFSKPDMMEGYSLIRQLADGEGLIVPGHDPKVCPLFKRVDLPGIYIYRIV